MFKSLYLGFRGLVRVSGFRGLVRVSGLGFLGFRGGLSR